MAPGARIRALKGEGPDKPLPEAGRKALGVAPDEPLRYRRVRLACGDHVLSEADNWYRPGLLTPEMNRTLDTTDTPFGAAVQALRFTRRNLSDDMLFQALPPGWEMRPPPLAGARSLAIPSEVLRHTAVLATGAGVPCSYVVETYRAGVLDF
jgi:hypothetical protein